jgi:hypothetical protein
MVRMKLDVNIRYVLREHERLEDERREISQRVAAWVQRSVARTAFGTELTSADESEQRDISLRVAAWVLRCAALATFRAELTSEEQSQVSIERARRAVRRRRWQRHEPVLIAVHQQSNGGDDATRKTTECALQSAR